MVCPVDGTPLQLADCQGVEIGYCPTCRGVWLERGELDYIIERSAGQMTVSGRGRERDFHEDDDYGDYPPDCGYAGDRHERKRGRGSFLGDFFDFD